MPGKPGKLGMILRSHLVRGAWHSLLILQITPAQLLCSATVWSCDSMIHRYSHPDLQVSMWLELQELNRLQK